MKSAFWGKNGPFCMFFLLFSQAEIIFPIWMNDRWYNVYLKTHTLMVDQDVQSKWKAGTRCLSKWRAGTDRGQLPPKPSHLLEGQGSWGSGWPSSSRFPSAVAHQVLTRCGLPPLPPPGHCVWQGLMPVFHLQEFEWLFFIKFLIE